MQRSDSKREALVYRKSVSKNNDFIIERDIPPQANNK